MGKYFALPLVVLIASCNSYGGTMNYSGPGDFQDFAKARYECSSGSKGQSSGGYIDAYSGSYSSRTTVNCGMMDACMASKGYTRDPNGIFDATSMKVQCS